MEIVYLEFVESDLSDGRKFYDDQEPGVGSYFVESILADAESLTLHAGVHRKVFNFHRLIGKTFPFAVYYRIENDQARVYAILDMRRDPTWLREELQSRD